jgi:uncharacterized protein (TIGR00255 family)
MTGFARCEGAAPGEDGENWRWAWEARSVNSKGLDLKLRVPIGWEAIEPLARARAGARLRRGAVQLSLSVASQRPQAGADQVDLAFAEYLLAQGEPLIAAGRVEKPRWDGLLRVRNVLRGGESDAAAGPVPAAWMSCALETLDGALDALCAARQREGAALAKLLIELIGHMEASAVAARREAQAGASAQDARLRERLAAMQVEVDPQRLAQELALLAVKADITEELDRLDAHVQEARALLTQTEPIGRRLEFLSQELSREANTLCAKSNSLNLTRLGLDLKTMIDQFREQAANVE